MIQYKSLMGKFGITHAYVLLHYTPALVMPNQLSQILTALVSLNSTSKIAFIHFCFDKLFSAGIHPQDFGGKIQPLLLDYTFLNLLWLVRIFSKDYKWMRRSLEWFHSYFCNCLGNIYDIESILNIITIHTIMTRSTGPHFLILSIKIWLYIAGILSGWIFDFLRKKLGHVHFSLYKYYIFR